MAITKTPLTAAQKAKQKMINGLDLQPIVQITRQEENWTAKQASDAELWYKNFLFMAYLSWPNPVFAMDRLADKLWHNHILDTVRYKADCDAIFGAGKFLDHHPIVGQPTKAQSAAMVASLNQSVNLFGTIPFDLCSGCW